MKPPVDQEPGYTLLTGATGLVGQYLMRDLLAAGVRLAVVVRPGRRDNARVRVERIMQHWESEAGHNLPRPVVMQGDTTHPDFGLSAEDLRWIEEHCNSMIQNAAILKFQSASRDQEPWLTNVEGTRHALALAEKAGIRDLHYMSTAYVCGNRFERILESDFDCQQNFRNDYERSKFEAEQLVRQNTAFDNITIYRPVAITGDSKTGYTSSYHGIYLYLRLIALYVPEQDRDVEGKLADPVQIPMHADSKRNGVTVDWVSQVFCHLFLDPDARGHTFHLASQTRFTNAELLNACFDYFDFKGAEFRAEGVAPDHKQPEFARKIFDSGLIYKQYESTDPVFDTTNLQKFAGHIACPPIDKQTIHRYLDYGIADQWGKSRPAAITVPDHSELLEAIGNWWIESGKSARGVKRCGIRITGPGGGDWTLQSERDELVVEAGLAGGCDAVLCFDATALRELEEFPAAVDAWLDKCVSRELMRRT